MAEWTQSIKDLLNGPVINWNTGLVTGGLLWSFCGGFLLYHLIVSSRNPKPSIPEADKV